MKKDFPSFSIVLETENLGMAGLEDLVSGLQSLQKQTLSPENAREVLIVAGGHVSEDTQELLRKDFPWTKIITPEESLSYTEAKMFGAKTATSDVVVFVDSDVHYEPTWLENLIGCFVSHPETSIACGETIVRGGSIYTTALNLMWMLPIKESIQNPTRTNVFHLNNFAMRRDVFLATPFPPPLPLYRGQVPLWQKSINRAGYIIRRVPGARGRHAPPQDFFDWWYRMLIYGRDFIAKTDFVPLEDGTFVEKRNLLKRWFGVAHWIVYRAKVLITRFVLLVREQPQRIHIIVLSIPVAIFFIAITILGCIITCFNRDYLLKKIQAREEDHIV